MTEAERYDAVVIGSGEGGKYLAWDMAQAGQKVAVMERRWIGGSCPKPSSVPITPGPTAMTEASRRRG